MTSNLRSDIAEKIMDIYMEANAYKITPKEFSDRILELFNQAEVEARIDELTETILTHATLTIRFREEIEDRTNQLSKSLKRSRP